jgi:membrane protein
VKSLLDAAPLGWLVELLGRLVPIAMVVVAFTFAYVFVPNTRVRPVAALTGGLVAGVSWNLAGAAFAAFMSSGSNVTIIYSGFATPILFMLWLYLGWLILLIGADIAFYRQHPEFLEGRRIALGLSEQDRQIIALEALRQIGRAFEAGEPSPDVTRIARTAAVPADVAGRLLRIFERAGIIAPTADQPPRWLPARPWESVPLHAVIEALRRAPTADVRAHPDPEVSDSVKALAGEIDGAIVARLGERSLRDFALDDR